MMVAPNDPATPGAFATLSVDLGALAANYRAIVATAAPARVAAVVKADAYGLGAVPVSTRLYAEGCRHFFVAQLGEAAVLRPVLPADATLWVLNGLPPGAEAACAALGAVPVLNSIDQIARWAAIGRLPAALHIDTGMARLGLSGDELATLLARPALIAGIDLRLVMSHLACGDTPGDAANARQSALFESAAAHFPGIPRSLDNSGGTFQHRAEHFDIVRPGIALYGGAPHGGAPNPMRAVARLTAPVVQLRDLPAGQGLGYGQTGAAAHDRRIAAIGVGYADGWPRRLGNRGSAFVDGTRVPIAGRVSMDSMMLDVTGVPCVPGTPVELLGPHQGIDAVAADADTIAYEILTSLGHRYARVYDG